MSTRCQIGIYSSKDKNFDEFDVLLYRHYDGYPGTPDGEYGVLADIVPFLVKWVKVRGICNTEYCGARLLHYLCSKYDQAMLGRPYEDHFDFLDNIVDKYSNAAVLGHGIFKHIQWPIDYFYKIYPNAIEIYSPKFNVALDVPQPIFDQWQLLQTVSINKAANSPRCPRYFLKAEEAKSSGLKPENLKGDSMLASLYKCVNCTV